MKSSVGEGVRDAVWQLFVSLIIDDKDDDCLFGSREGARKDDDDCLFCSRREHAKIRPVVS